MSQKKNSADLKPQRPWRRHRMLLYFVASVIAFVALITVNILFLKKYWRLGTG